MSSNIAIVFPGQGSQSLGMLADLAQQFSIVNELFEQASEILHKDLWKIVLEGPIEELNKTVNTQPAMLTADFAMWRVFSEVHKEIQPVLMAGHSLGEYSALVASGAMAFPEAVALVAKRAELMQTAVPQNEGGMAVILGLSLDNIAKACMDAARIGLVEPVNFNAPGQIVIAGNIHAVNKACELAKSAGAKRAMLIPVSVPAHSQLMKPAAEKFKDYLDKVEISQPKYPVMNNVDVEIELDPEMIRTALFNQLFNPVRWIEIIEKMVSDGIKIIIECGPGKVLTGLNKRITSEATSMSLDGSDLDTFSIE